MIRRAPYLQTLLVALGWITLLELEPAAIIQQPGNMVVALVFTVLVGQLGGGRGEQAIVLLSGWIPPIVALTFGWGSLSTEVRAAMEVLWGVQSLSVTLILARRLLRETNISLDELWGAIAVYVMLGVTFASAYEIFMEFDPTALIYTNLPADAAPGFSDFLYFSFVTLGTVGYGDVAPVARGVRLVAMFEALVGLMYIAVVLGRVVAMHTAGRIGQGVDAGEANTVTRAD